MNFLEERIAKDGIVKPGNVLKVDSFLNHQMDISLMNEIGREFHRRFARKQVTKVLTIEASGIAIAYPVANEFGVPMVFAKKSKSINIEGEMYVAEVESFTHKNKNQVIVSKKFLGPEDHVLIIDDFLANGCASFRQPGGDGHRGPGHCGGKRISDRRQGDPESGLSSGIPGHCGLHGCGNGDYSVPAAVSGECGFWKADGN